MENIIFLLAGAVVVGAIAILLFNFSIRRMKESFSSLSMDALSKNSEQFLKLANETLSRQTDAGEKELEGKKKLIDQTLVQMKAELQRIQDVIAGFEKDRAGKFTELASQLKSSAEITNRLQDTANQLKSALASTKVRGQWGERMAEDVLRLAGFIEGVNYLKQKTMESGGTRPDYTFLLPDNFKLNMDVKFSLNNYLRYLEADGMEKEGFKTQFMRDVRARVKEVTSREYINPEENTVECVLVFIPNESIYSFIIENDGSLIDDALKNRVIICSPMTLYAILAIIRQTFEIYNLERTTGDMLALLGAFAKQWEMFCGSLEKMGKRIDEARDEYQKLTTTRRNQLERQLKKIEDLRRQKGIESAALVENLEE
ncbi:MAG: DNA recombination protein RmuC [Deltaproteobacteria bacterium]|nr:DNA recombination protein RmuC [Deltaproteobacteria bacterium]